MVAVGSLIDDARQSRRSAKSEATRFSADVEVALCAIEEAHERWRESVEPLVQRALSDGTVAPDIDPEAVLAFTRTNSKALFGNLLTLPVGDGLLYVQPLYTLRESGEGTYPVLRYVLVSFGKDVGYGPTLASALNDVLGITDGDEPFGDPGDPAEPGVGADVWQSSCSSRHWPRIRSSACCSARKRRRRHGWRIRPSCGSSTPVRKPCATRWASRRRFRSSSWNTSTVCR